MLKWELLDKISSDNHGILKLQDAIGAGISKTYIFDYIKKHEYEQVARGIYVAPDAWEDSLYILQTRYKGAIFSHETALYLLGLAEREPLKYTVTLKQGYNPAHLTRNGVKVYTVKKEWHSMGITEVQSPMGHMLYSYNAERTLCDILRGHSEVEIQDMLAAVREYVRGSDKDIPLLMEYAKIFKVEKRIKHYLEVLLQ